VAAEIRCFTVTHTLTTTTEGTVGTVLLVVTRPTSSRHISNGHRIIPSRDMAAITKVVDPRNLMADKHTIQLPVEVHLVGAVSRALNTITLMAPAGAVMERPMGVLVEISVVMAVTALVEEGTQDGAATLVTPVMVVMGGRLLVDMATVVAADHTRVAEAEAAIDSLGRISARVHLYA